MHYLELALLGSFEVRLSGQRVKGLTSEKMRALLAYLAVEADRPHTREQLAELLWPDRPPGIAAQNLRQSLTRLQRLLPQPSALQPFLLITRHTVQFNLASDVWLDTAAFETARAACQQHAHKRLDQCRQCAPQLDTLANLYRGEFLADLIADSAPFEEWSVLKREWYRREALHALDHLTRRLDWQGRYEQAYQLAWRQVEIDPLREEAHAQVIRSLTLSGRPREALLQYENLRQLLHTELNVEPADDTTLLMEQIRDGSLLQAAHTSAQRHNLPRQFSPLIGREAELAQLDDWLDDEACALLTIWGPGGVGKTRLAIEVARRRVSRYRDGVTYVPLAAVTQPDRLIAAMAASLGATFAGQLDPQQQLLNYLRNKELLLVLNNFEQLIAGVDVVAAILEHAPGVKIIVTSREALKLRAEWLYQLNGLTVDGRDDSAAVQLFVQTAQRARRDFDYTRANAAAILRLCRLVDGLPLAIELAAAQVRDHTCAEIAAAVEQNLDVLSTSLRDVPERQRNLRALFEYSWALLQPIERGALMSLSLFRSGASSNAAAQVAQAAPKTLSALVDQSLLHRSDGDRYEMHELVRQYAAEKLAETAGDYAAAQRRFVAYFAAWTQQRESELRDRRQATALLLIEPEIENLRTAWEWSIAAGDEAAIDQLMTGLFRFFRLRSWFVQGDQTIALVIDWLGPQAPTAARRILLGRALTWRGVFAYSLARLSEARAALVESCELLKRDEDRSLRAAALSHLCHVAAHLGQHADAERYGRESLELFRAAQDRSGEAMAALNLGNVFKDRGDFEQGRQFYQRSLELQGDNGDPRATAATLNNLGTIAQQTGAYAEAKNLYARAAQNYRELADRYGQALTLTNLGIIADIQGDYPEAIRLYQSSLELRREIGERLGMSYSYSNLGFVAYEQGEYVKARRLLQQGLDLKIECGERRTLASSYFDLGLVAIELGEYAEAERQLQLALRGALAVQSALQAMEILSGVAALWLRTNQFEAALLADIFALVIEHPATSQEVREKTQRLRAEWLTYQPGRAPATHDSDRSWEDIAPAVLDRLHHQIR